MDLRKEREGEGRKEKNWQAKNDENNVNLHKRQKIREKKE